VVLLMVVLQAQGLEVVLRLALEQEQGHQRKMM
jgi:hypothetical protein